MNALVPLRCPNSAHKAATAALVRRVEAVARANEDRQDTNHARPAAQQGPAQQARPARPIASLAAQILGSGYAAEGATGYDAYIKASKLLSRDTQRNDVGVL
jgi:hypothetical protein